MAKKKTAAPARPRWVMPKWMVPYRAQIVNTGGNTIEEIMNWSSSETNIQTNAPRALIQTAVESQVLLLANLHNGGKI